MSAPSEMLLQQRRASGLFPGGSWKRQLLPGGAGGGASVLFLPGVSFCFFSLSILLTPPPTPNTASLLLL